MHPGCVMVPHRKIGNNAVIGTGSVVLSNVKANTTVFGNPAKKIDF
jgi:acetyltransferase-like isoleucine patch superfamily enzyme